MLRRESIQAAYPIAAGLASQAIVLVPAEDTPVQALINCVQPGADVLHEHRDATTGLESYDQLLVQVSSTPTPDGTVPHDTVKAELVEMGRLAISSGLNLARNIVNPKIERVVKEVSAFVDADMSNTLGSLSIETIFYAPVWDSPIIEQLMGRHQNQFTGDFQLRPLGLPVPSDWSPILRTGIPSIDAQLAEWVSGLNSDFLRDVWEETFGLRTKLPLAQVLGTSIGSAEGQYGRLDAPLVVYLAARYLADNVGAGVNMDLGAYRVYMSELAGRAGQAAMAVLQRRSSDVRRGQIVVSVPRGLTGSVQVLGDSYNEFLRNGGSPEAVFGAVVTNRIGDLTLQPNPSVIDELTQAWRSVRNLRAQEVQLRRRDTTIRGLKISLFRIIDEADEADLPPNIPRAVFHKLADEKLAALGSFKQDDLWRVARGLVCQVLYAHTDAERILQAIDDAADYAAANGDQLSVREAALIGVIEFTTLWLLEQVDTRKIPLE